MFLIEQRWASWRLLTLCGKAWVGREARGDRRQPAETSASTQTGLCTSSNHFARVHTQMKNTRVSSNLVELFIWSKTNKARNKKATNLTQSQRVVLHNKFHSGRLGQFVSNRYSKNKIPLRSERVLSQNLKYVQQKKKNNSLDRSKDKAPKFRISRMTTGFFKVSGKKNNGRRL